jgi:hypothetical protein
MGDRYGVPATLNGHERLQEMFLAQMAGTSKPPPNPGVAEPRGGRYRFALAQVSVPRTKHMMPRCGVQHTTARPIGLSARCRMRRGGTVIHLSSTHTS